MKALFFVEIFLLSISQNALAILGQPASSIDQDMAALSATLQDTTDHHSYRVDELKSTQGFTLREYIGTDGIVFGVAWNGHRHPDLETTLGEHVGAFNKDAKGSHKPGKRSHHSVKNSKIAVERWGHAGDLHGRAYLPSRLPAGFNSNDLK